MSKFSQASQYQLSTCHPDLSRLMYAALLRHDCTVIQGHRPEEEQERLYMSGASKVLHGKHNVMPSEAVDAAPFIQGRGIPWPQVGSKTYASDLAQFYYFAGIVMATAAELGIKIRWGGDWDRDNDLADQSFNDLVHFELVS